MQNAPYYMQNTPSHPASVGRGPFRCVDDERFDRTLGRFEPQPELLLDRLKKRWAGRCRARALRPPPWSVGASARVAAGSPKKAGGGALPLMRAERRRRTEFHP